MVTTLEAACKLEDVEFLGWTRVPAGDSIRLKKGNLHTVLALPHGKLELMSVESLAKQIHVLFAPSSSAS